MVHGLGTLSTHAELGFRSLDVTSAVRSDVLAGRGITMLRLRHRAQTNLDSDADYCAFGSPDWPEASRRASLVVSFTLP